MNDKEFDGDDRDNFAGVWIPAEIWLRKDLCPTEKFLLAEIESLNVEEGCRVSNECFASIMGVSVSRVIQMLKKLKDKNLITIENRSDKTRVMRTFPRYRSQYEN